MQYIIPFILLIYFISEGIESLLPDSLITKYPDLSMDISLFLVFGSIILFIVLGIVGHLLPIFQTSKIWFGKHKGKKWSEVPENYLHWIISTTEKEHIKNLARTELNRRLKLSSPSDEDKEKMKRVGSDFEKRVGKYYELRGYKVDYRGERLGYNDQGIDLIVKNDYETILIQCKCWSKEKSITEKMLREFYGACYLYLDNKTLSDNTRFLYAIPEHKIMSNAAYKICDNLKTRLRYQVFNYKI